MLLHSENTDGEKDRRVSAAVDESRLISNIHHHILRRPNQNFSFKGLDPGSTFVIEL